MSTRTLRPKLNVQFGKKFDWATVKITLTFELSKWTSPHKALALP